MLKSSVLKNLLTAWNISDLSGCSVLIGNQKNFPCVIGNTCLRKQNLNLFPYKYDKICHSVTLLYIHFIFEYVNCSGFMHKIQALTNQHFVVYRITLHIL